MLKTKYVILALASIGFTLSTIIASSSFKRSSLSAEELNSNSTLIVPGVINDDLLSAQVCGDKIQAHNEFCFLPTVKVTDFGGGVDAIASGRINTGNPLDFVASSAVGDAIRIRTGNGSGGFNGTWTYTMGDGPTDVAIADFNNDGHTDIIATNFHDDKARIRWGTGASWGNWSHWDVGDGPWRVATADLNGDGLDDFVTTNILGNTLTVRLRTQSGSFVLPVTYSAGDGNNDVKLADCDSDGDRDMIYPSGLHTGGIRVRKNNGNGAFGNVISSDLALNQGESVSSIVLGDWNEDGKLDVIATIAHRMVRMLGDGNCSFSSRVSAQTETNPTRIYTSDIDRDGHLDLIVGHFNTLKISLYRGLGTGNFSSPRVYNQNEWVYDLTTGDFNGDGTPDIVYTGNEGVYLMESNP